MPRAPQDIYARHLLSPRGYPLWTPEPSNELLEERRDGLKIGDVGVVLDDGGFDVLFNLTLPPDHVFHLRHGVPLGFTCVDPDQLDIRTIANAEPPGYVISSSVTRDKTFGSSRDVWERRDSNNPPYKFNLSSSEGALLILPQGAERYDLLNEDVFLEQATLHAAKWYDYAVSRRRRIISADSLYLITGIHKTIAWSVAAFENASENEHHMAQFKQIQGVQSPPTYGWETTTCAFDWRVGPYIDVGIPNQAVFIRGFKIAIRSGFLGTRWVSVEAEAPSTRFNRVRSSSATPGSIPMFGSLAGFLGYKDSNVFRTTTRSEGIIDTPEEQGTSSIPYNEHDSTRVEIQRIPDVPPVSHPSDAINQYLFRTSPSAKIAITHDNHWISLLESASLTCEELRIPSFLETVLSQNCCVVSDEGTVYLKKKPLELTGNSPGPPSMSTSFAPNVNSWPTNVPYDASISGSAWGGGFSDSFGTTGSGNLPMGMGVRAPPPEQAFPVAQPRTNHRAQTPAPHWQPWANPVRTAGQHPDQRRTVAFPETRQPGVPSLPLADPPMNTGHREWRQRISGHHTTSTPANAATRSDHAPVPATAPSTQPRGEWRGPIDAPTFQCLWMTRPGVYCSAQIPSDRRSITNHFHDAHKLTNNDTPIRCAWPGCGASLQPRNVSRHIFTCHFEIKSPCPKCGLPLSRADAIKKHQLSCPGETAPGGSGPSREDGGGYYQHNYQRSSRG